MLKVQNLEKKKLQLTVQLQIAKQKEQDDKKEICDIDSESKVLQRNLNELVEEINEVLEEIRYFLADLTDEPCR